MGGAPSADVQAAAAGAGGPSKDAQKDAAEEQRQAMLTSILDPAARERVQRVALVNPEKARAIENSLIQAARQGRLAGRVGEDQVISMLERMGGGDASKEKKVVIQRRKGAFDSDEEDAEDGWNV
jgi:programmed cell death protein 5